MSQQDLLRRVVAALERLEIDYMITGSIATSLQGEPRATEPVSTLYGDALRLYEVQHSRLDQDYLAEWARFLNVEQELARIRNESEPVFRQE